jgi:hypothetical protein
LGSVFEFCHIAKSLMRQIIFTGVELSVLQNDLRVAGQDPPEFNGIIWLFIEGFKNEFVIVPGLTQTLLFWFICATKTGDDPKEKKEIIKTRFHPMIFNCHCLGPFGGDKFIFFRRISNFFLKDLTGSGDATDIFREVATPTAGKEGTENILT